jgi:hypothetical protein
MTTIRLRRQGSGFYSASNHADVTDVKYLSCSVFRWDGVWSIRFFPYRLAAGRVTTDEPFVQDAWTLSMARGIIARVFEAYDGSWAFNTDLVAKLAGEAYRAEDR